MYVQYIFEYIYVQKQKGGYVHSKNFLSYDITVD